MTYGDEQEVTGLVGANITLRPPLTPANYLSQANNTINTRLYKIYQTPLDFTNSPDGVKDYIDGIANYIAAGGLVMAFSRGEENAAVHAYGKWLYDQAMLELAKIQNGDTVLPGVPASEVDEGPVQTPLPLVFNEDPASLVGAFYEFAQRPNPQVW